MKQLVHTLAAIAAIAFVAYPTVTSVHTGNRILPALLPPPSATVIFGGDMLFDRTIRGAMEAKGEDFIFSCIDEVLSEADVVVANLEGPITEHPSVSLGSAIRSPENFTFTFPTSVAPLLARHNIRLVNLGNNHILNFGWDGARSTLEHLRAAEVGYFGDPLEKRVAREELNGVMLAFIGYNEFASNGWRTNAEAVLSEIKSALADEYVPVVYTHWGDEYSAEPPERVRALARTFIDAGAAIIIGSHPHVVQRPEMYRGKYIYYSLGNFFFDQYWSDAVRTGLLLRVSFAPGVVSIEEIPVVMERTRQTCPIAS